MNVLRRTSTARLLGAVLIVLVASGATAFAVTHRGAAKPPARPLAVALHQAVTAGPVAGVSARISFTNHLLPSGSLGGTSMPLLSGASGRLWVGGGRARLELQADRGDTEIAWNGRTVTVYDVASGTAYGLPLHAGRHAGHDAGGAHPVPTVAMIRHALARVSRFVALTGAIPSNVGGQPAYAVRVSPRHDGGLLGAVELAWDANHGVPLKVAVYAQGSSSPVLALGVTDISYGKVAASDLAVHLAPGTRIVRVTPPSKPAKTSAHRPAVTGAAAVARALPFRLAAPRALVGLPRQTVRLVDWAGSPAAMAVYGRGLGAVVVLEQRADGGTSPLAALPRVAIRGAAGHELATALGTAIQFDRGGVRTTVIGSLPPAAAEAAARAIG
jgi:hypothetical protein